MTAKTTNHDPMNHGSTGPRPLALVTGASSGIGQAFARRLGRDGFDLIVVGRRADRLDHLVADLSDVAVRPVIADLGSDNGIAAVAAICGDERLDLLVNNAGVAHYMPFAQLPAQKAAELLHVKVIAPTMLALAAVPGMVGRNRGTIVNVAGMLAFGSSAPLGERAGRATYGATLAQIVALSQGLHDELAPHGLRIQALCPGIVATEFHDRQGIDLSALPRMAADDVVTASLAGLELGEVICAPGVEQGSLLDAIFAAQLCAFGAQSPQLAKRYRELDRSVRMEPLQ